MAFDPYYHWLGIPENEQPPDYYRLLGVARFESNADVIDTAAARQMSHVRSFQNGPRSADSQQLMNELAEARIVLLDPVKKRAYDEGLADEQGSPQPGQSQPTSDDDIWSNLPEPEIATKSKERKMPVVPVTAAVVGFAILLLSLVKGLMVDDQIPVPESVERAERPEENEGTVAEPTPVALDINWSDVLVLYSFNDDEVVEADGAAYLRDLGPHKIQGRMNGVSIVEKGKVGSGLSFNGKSHVQFSRLRELILDELEGLTVCCWAKASRQKELSFLFDVGFFAEHSISLVHQTDDVGFFLLGNRTARSKPALMRGWHHYCGVWNGDEVMVYVDGKLANSIKSAVQRTGGSVIHGPRARLGIHAKHDNRYKVRFFSGVMDEFLIVRRALSPQVVQRIYDLGQERKSVAELINSGPAVD